MTIISNVDFHCHTQASDGAFTPSQVVDRAYSRGLNFLAITDHDLVSGVQEAIQRAQYQNAKLLEHSEDALKDTLIKANALVTQIENGVLERSNEERLLTIIPGIEISTTWENEQIHMVGLGLDINHSKLQELIEKLKVKRTERAVGIGLKLERLGFERPYERCCEKAQEGASITRGNYARLIYEDGKAHSIDEAFHKFLRRGQPAYVKTEWVSIPEAVETVLAAGGIPILAHPRRYKISNGRLRKLIKAFKDAGGTAMEVSSSQQKPVDREYLIELSQKFELQASLGSDFHNEGIYRDLGQNLNLDSKLTPVWHDEKLQAFGLNADFKQRLVHVTYQKVEKAEKAENSDKAE